jgi:hypothetical protein
LEGNRITKSDKFTFFSGDSINEMCYLPQALEIIAFLFEMFEIPRTIDLVQSDETVSSIVNRLIPATISSLQSVVEYMQLKANTEAHMSTLLFQ